MSKFKIGDEFEVLSNNGFCAGVGIGDHVVLMGFEEDECHKFKSKKNGKIVYFFEKSVKKIEVSSLKTSNRYKLHKYISTTGFSKLDLSRALSKGDSFLSVETRESQFTNRGDMSDARYKSLRKQIKEAIDTAKSLNDKTDNEVFNEVCSKNAESFVEDFDEGFDDLKEKINHKKLELNINGQVFNFLPNESVSIEIPTKKPSNNSVSILALVFFVMLVVFILGCFIYKAA